MFGSNGFVTYKRKRLSSRTAGSRGNGCPSSHSDGQKNPVSLTSDKHDDLGDAHSSESRKTSLMTNLECFLCGFTGNLHQCEDCYRSYHLLCHDRSRKRGRHRRILPCGCTRKRNLTPHPVRRSSRLKEKDGSNTGVSSLVSNPGDETLEKHTDGSSPIEMSLKINSSLIREGCSLNINSGCADDTIPCGERSASQPVGMLSQQNLAAVNLTFPFERKYSSLCDNGSFVEKTTKLKGNSHSKVESTNICSDTLVQAKWNAPLITFSRRSKRKRDVEGSDTKKTFLPEEKNVSCKTAYSKDIPVEHASDQKHSSGDLDRALIICRNQDKINDVGSPYSPAGCALEANVLQNDGEHPWDGENMSNDASSIDGTIYQHSNIAMTIQEDHPNCCLRTSLNGVVIDTLGSTVVDKETNNPEIQAGTGEESQNLSTQDRKEREKNVSGRQNGSLPCLNLPPTTPDSEFHLQFLDSKGSPILRKTSSAAILETINERIPTSPSTPHKQDVENSVEGIETSPSTPRTQEVDASFKHNRKAPPAFTQDITLKDNHGQLLSEENPSGTSDLAVKHREETACLVSEKGKSQGLRSNENPTEQNSDSPSLFLSLSLPTEPSIGGYTLRDSSVPRPAFFPSNGKEFCQDAVPQYLSNQTLTLRRKRLLNDILYQGRDLNASLRFQDNVMPYTMKWLEEELDSLWIGVRRYGRDWDAILMDPRLHFSSWRVARDLAKQWEEEQFKLLNGTKVSQFRYSKANSGNQHWHPNTGMNKGNVTDEVQLSLGDMYAHKEHNLFKRPCPNWRIFLGNNAGQSKNPFTYTRTPFSDHRRQNYDRGSFNSPEVKAIPLPRSDSLPINTPLNRFGGNLPHWLREAVTTMPSRLGEPAPPPSFAHAGRFPAFQSHSTLNEPNIRQRNEYGIQLSSSYNPLNHKNHKTAQKSKVDTEKVVILGSDASSEETISDHH